MDRSTKQEIEGNWDQFKGRIKQEWGELTDDDLTQAEGRAEELVGIIEERTGQRRRRIEERLDELHGRRNV